MAKVRFSRADASQVFRRIETARKYTEQTFKARDERHAKAYRGNYEKEFPSVGLLDHIVMNYLGQNIDLAVAGLAAEPPIFRFKPRGSGGLDFPTRELLARLWGAYIPYLWREGDVHRQMKAALRDKEVFGRGWVGIDWKLETQEQYYEGDRPEDVRTEEVILYDNPIVRRIPPHRIYLDPEVDTLNWEEAQYIVWSMSWPLERVRRWAKSDSRVRSEVANKLKGNEQIDPKLMPDVDVRSRDEDVKRATIYRYHERERNLVVYLAQEQPETPLLVLDNPYHFEGYPFEPIFARPVLENGGKFDAVGRAESLIAWQRLLNVLRSKQATMVRTARHAIAVPTTMAEDEITALETNEERVIIKVDPGAQFPPKELNTSGFPPEFIQLEGSLRLDLTEIGGQTALRRGVIQPGLDTATESSLLVSQSSVGDRNQQFEWEDFNSRVVRKDKALLEQFGDSERLAAISPEVAKGLRSNLEVGVEVTPGEQFTWVRFTPQQIVDEHEIEVLAGSMGAKEQALELAQLRQGVALIIQVAQTAPVLQAMGLNPQEIAKELMRRSGNTDTDRFFQSPQPLPAGMMPSGVRPAPGNGGQGDLESMLKSVIESTGPGQGSVAGGGT